MRSNAFRNEHAALGGAVPERLNRLVRWRVLPSNSLLDTIKNEHHETPLGSIALYWRDLAATNQVFAVKGSQRARYSRSIFLECGWVINFKFRDDIPGTDLDLLRADSAAANAADCNASCEGNQKSIGFGSSEFPPFAPKM